MGQSLWRPIAGWELPRANATEQMRGVSDAERWTLAIECARQSGSLQPAGGSRDSSHASGAQPRRWTRPRGSSIRKP